SHYEGMNTHHRWRCAAGHEWSAIPSSIRAGHWCPQCYGNKRLSLDDLRKIARLISTEYRNRRSLLRWQCATGHVWETAAANVMAGRWCPVCGARRLTAPRGVVASGKGSSRITLEDARAAAEEQGGRCLSEIYTNARKPLHWQCRQGHDWRTSLGHVRSGKKWCPVCSRKCVDCGIARI